MLVDIKVIDDMLVVEEKKLIAQLKFVLIVELCNVHATHDVRCLACLFVLLISFGLGSLEQLVQL